MRDLKALDMELQDAATTLSRAIRRFVLAAADWMPMPEDANDICGDCHDAAYADLAERIDTLLFADPKAASRRRKAAD